MRPRVCCHDGCAAPATGLGVILVRPPRPHGGELTAYLDLPLCDDHGATLSLKKLMTDEGWEVLKTSVIEATGVPPDRGRTGVAHVPWAKCPDVFVKRSRYEP